MDLPLNILKKAPDLKELDIEYDIRDSKFLQLYSAFKNAFTFTGHVDAEFVEFLTTQNINSVAVMSNQRLLEYLRTSYPEYYPKPNANLNLADLLKRTQEYAAMNSFSNKKRKLTVLQDVYYHELRNDKRIKIIPYNSSLGEKSVEQLVKIQGHTDPIQVLDSESGVLVFIPDVKDFKLKVDLFAILSQFDFQILDSNSLKEALTLYTEKQPKMVIIANLNSDPISKQFLLELEEVDPYVKKLNYTESPSTNRAKEQKRIEHHYYSGYKEILDTEKETDLKETLPEEIKITILANIKELEANFSVQSYYEKAYALKQFGRHFNIKILWNMMLNVRKKMIRG